MSRKCHNFESGKIQCLYTFYKWKAKYGGLEVSERRRLKTPEDENARRQARSYRSSADLLRGERAAGVRSTRGRPDLDPLSQRPTERYRPAAMLA